MPSVQDFLKLLGLSTKRLPKHIAITMNGTTFHAQQKNLVIGEVIKKRFDNIKNLIESSVKLNIPITTFYAMSDKQIDDYEIMMDVMQQFFEDLRVWHFLDEHQVKVSILGKWYDLPSRVVEPMKKCIEATSEYDKFFINFCINYNGREEVVDSVKLLARQLSLGKIGIDEISADSIKENMATSYFIPPDLIIKTGRKSTTRGFLLWDSADSVIYFSGIAWPEFGRKDLLRGIEFYQKSLN